MAVINDTIYIIMKYLPEVRDYVNCVLKLSKICGDAI